MTLSSQSATGKLSYNGTWCAG